MESTITFCKLILRLLTISDLLSVLTHKAVYVNLRTDPGKNSEMAFRLSLFRDNLVLLTKGPSLKLMTK